MSFPTARRIGAAYAIASTLHRFGSSIATTWKPRATARTLTKWRIYDDRTRDPRRWLLLGHARPYSPPGRRDLDAGGLYGWGRAERYLSQSRNSCRSHRDRLRSRQNQLPEA